MIKVAHQCFFKAAEATRQYFTNPRLTEVGLRRVSDDAVGFLGNISYMGGRLNPRRVPVKTDTRLRRSGSQTRRNDGVWRFIQKWRPSTILLTSLLLSSCIASQPPYTLNPHPSSPDTMSDSGNELEATGSKQAAKSTVDPIKSFLSGGFGGM